LYYKIAPTVTQFIRRGKPRPSASYSDNIAIPNSSGANNTGDESSDKSRGKTFCVSRQLTRRDAALNLATPEVQYFVIGNTHYSLMNSIAYSPGIRLHGGFRIASGYTHLIINANMWQNRKNISTLIENYDSSYIPSAPIVTRNTIAGDLRL
jgi:hypothetical protein